MMLKERTTLNHLMQPSKPSKSLQNKQVVFFKLVVKKSLENQSITHHHSKTRLSLPVNLTVKPRPTLNL